MIRLFALLTIIGLLSCGDVTIEEKGPDQLFISGQLDNYKDQSLYIRGYNANHKIEVNEDGYFADTINYGDAYYTFYIDRASFPFSANAGQSIQFAGDASDPKSNIVISGGNEEATAYLEAKKVLSDSLKTPTKELYSLGEEEFLSNIQDYKKAMTEHLNSLSNLDPSFVKNELANLDYSFFGDVNRYESYHEYFAEKEGYKSTNLLTDITKDVDYDNEELYNSIPSYRGLANSHFSDGLYGDNSLENASKLLDLKSPSLKKSLVSTLKYSLSPSNEDLDSIYSIIHLLTSDEDVLAEVDEKYTKVKELVEGKPSPTFENYENHAGGTTSFDDLKGKYTYIDVWATWCGPCLGEIPSLKEVEKSYHDKNINFLSISIDREKDHDTWIKMVNDKELKGIQLMADNAWDSKFVKDYVIDGIPRFILLDPEGNIVSADAPRPSDDGLIELFDKQGI